MKLVLIVTTIFCAQIVCADSFTLVKDGKNYLCQEQTTNPGAGVNCGSKAYNGPFTKAESIQLCTGATSDAPADCGIAAYNGPFNKQQAIELCTGATVSINGPAECGIKAYNGPFNVAEAIQICKKGTIANADCAINAYNGAYTRHEAIQLCQSSVNSVVIIQGQKFIKEMTIFEKTNILKNKLNDLKINK